MDGSHLEGPQVSGAEIRATFSTTRQAGARRGAGESRACPCAHVPIRFTPIISSRHAENGLHAAELAPALEQLVAQYEHDACDHTGGSANRTHETVAFTAIKRVQP